MRSNAICVGLLAALMLCMTACGALDFGLGDDDFDPDDGASLDDGALVVDPLTEVTYVLANPSSGKKVLYSIHPDVGQIAQVADLSGADNVKLLFPQDRVLLITNKGAGDTLQLIDRFSYATIAEAQTTARYSNVRLSPTGLFMSAMDEVSGDVHIIDTQTLDQAALPHDASRIVTTWMDQRDELVAVLTYNAPLSTRIMSWNVNASLIMQDDGPVEEGFWPGVRVDIEQEGFSRKEGFNPTWIDVSADDELIAIPLSAPSNVDGEEVEEDKRAHVVVVIDTTTGQHTTLANMQGPTFFTPDGGSLVTWRGQTEDNPQPALVLVDTRDFEERTLELPFAEGVRQFASSTDGDYLVVERADGQALAIYGLGLDNNAPKVFEDTGATLQTSVLRPGKRELWTVNAGLLSRVNLEAFAVEEVALEFNTAHINFLPQRDRLVIDDITNERVAFVEPQTQAVVREVVIPVTPVEDPCKINGGAPELGGRWTLKGSGTRLQCRNPALNTEFQMPSVSLSIDQGPSIDPVERTLTLGEDVGNGTFEFSGQVRGICVSFRTTEVVGDNRTSFDFTGTLDRDTGAITGTLVGTGPGTCVNQGAFELQVSP